MHLATWVFLSVQVAIWVYGAWALLLRDRQPLVYWDEGRYFVDSAAIYVSSDFFSALRSVSFPLYCWPIVAFLRIAGTPMDFGLLAFLSMLFWLGVWILGSFYLCGRLRVPLGVGTTVLSFHFASAPSFTTSTMLMGDTAMAAWVVAVLFLLHGSVDRKHGWLFALSAGVAIGCGVQIKIVAIMAGMCALGGLLLMCSYRYCAASCVDRASVRRHYLACGIILGLSLLTTLTMIAPRGIFSIIDAYYYNNEQLGAWQDYSGIYNSWLWLANAIFETYPLVGLAAFLALLLVSYVLTFLCSGRSVKMVLKHLCTGNLLLIVAPILVAALFVSIFVVSKPIRPLYYLLPMTLFCLLLIVCHLAQLMRGFQRQLFGGALQWSLLGVSIINAASTCSWLTPERWQWLSHSYSLSAKKQLTEVPLFRRPQWQDTGLDDIYRALLEGASSRINHRTRILVPNYADILNASLLGNRWLTAEAIHGSNLPDRPPMDFIDFTFRYGAWGNFGGFPRAFFTAECILFSAAGWMDSLPDDLLLYPNLVCKRLAEYDPVYWDGLFPLIIDENVYGSPVILALRGAVPSPGSFLEIVREVATRDRNNLWNLPFLAAAQAMEPDPLFFEQIELMLADEFSADYIVSDPLSVEQIELLRASWPAIPPALHYPQLLFR